MTEGEAAETPVLALFAEGAATRPFAADAAALAQVRDGVVDALGCICAGARTEVAERARAAAVAMGAGAGPARVIGTDGWAPRPQAAFLNAVAAHALDFDDWELPGNTHPTAVILPALLAVAPAETRGAEIARAYLAGFEVIARLGEALNFEHYDAGWHSTATLGALGAAAGASRLLGADAAQMTNALSIAASAAAGYTCQFGSNAKPIQAGFAARAGVEAAYLAAAGMSGQAHALDHPRGMAALTSGVDPARLRAAAARFGDPLAFVEHGLVLKPWPSCGYTHRLMTCAVRLHGQVDPDQIDAIEAHLPDFHAAVIPFRAPRSRTEALFSAPFVVAMGLARGDLTLADVAREDASAAPWRAPSVARLIARATVTPYAPRRPDLNYAEEDPDRLVVRLVDGSAREERCVYPLGAPQAPMPERQLWAKFAVNVGAGAEAWSAGLRGWPAAARAVPLLSGEGVIA